MKRLDQRGETLVEVVMALGILSLVLVSSYALATGTFRLGRGAGERTQAVNYLQQQAEALRIYRDKSPNWSTFTQAVTPYNGADDGAKFCMVKDTSTDSWKPAPTSDAGCTIDGISIKVTTAANDPDLSQSTSGGLPEQYKFTMVANWKTASDDNTVSITTSLARQK